MAERAGLQVADAVIKVNGQDVYNLRHKEAQDVIVRAGNSYEIVVSRLVQKLMFDQRSPKNESSNFVKQQCVKAKVTYYYLGTLRSELDEKHESSSFWSGIRKGYE